MQIKICGIKTPDILETCIDAGADFIGFVHFPKSPRHLELNDIAKLVEQARDRVQSVVLLVDPDDQMIDQVSEIIAPDYIQLPGSESIARVAQIAARVPAIKILKALQVRTAQDLRTINDYAAVSVGLLLDAKPGPDAILPGGNGETFDWDIVSNQPDLPDFFLAGGLSLDNVAQAIAQVRPYGIDLSSAVEISRGVKDAQMIERFINQARAAENKI